jgi:hypothetical protein
MIAPRTVEQPDNAPMTVVDIHEAMPGWCLSNQSSRGGLGAMRRLLHVSGLW